MTTFYPVNHFSYGTTPLQRAIIERTDRGTINNFNYGSPEITARLDSIANAVESAYVLVEKATLPKVTNSPMSLTKRMFYFAGDPWVPYSTNPGHTAEQARKTAAKWLAIAQLLETEEKAAAAEAKKKADEEAAAKKARTNRLDGLADEYFGEYLEDLGPKKTRVIEDLYDLQEKLKTDGDAA